MEPKNEGMNKMKNILYDGIDSTKECFDLVFMIDATGSMQPFINAAKETSKNIAEELRNEYENLNFQYGYIFYRDPIDSKGDVHELINLTDDVNSLPEKLDKIIATGGGDAPEDWRGAYKMAYGGISWRNGVKVIVHMTDAGAHGKLFTKNDTHPEQEQLLIEELEKLAENKVKVFGYVIKEECRNSFNECQKIYRNKGGIYEIFTFTESGDKLNNMNSSIARENFKNEAEHQNMISYHFKSNVMNSVKESMRIKKPN